MENISPNIQAIIQLLGVTAEKYDMMTPEEIDLLIEQKIGKKLEYSNSVGNMIPRGNPLLVFGRFIDFQNVLKKFNKAF